MRSDAANGEVGLRVAFADADDRALKNLHALTVAFDNQRVHTHCVSGRHARSIGFLGSECIHDIHAKTSALQNEALTQERGPGL